MDRRLLRGAAGPRPQDHVARRTRTRPEEAVGGARQPRNRHAERAGRRVRARTASARGLRESPGGGRAADPVGTAGERVQPPGGQGPRSEGAGDDHRRGRASRSLPRTPDARLTRPHSDPGAGPGAEAAHRRGRDGRRLLPAARRDRFREDAGVHRTHQAGAGRRPRRHRPGSRDRADPADGLPLPGRLRRLGGGPPFGPVRRRTVRRLDRVEGRPPAHCDRRAFGGLRSASAGRRDRGGRRARRQLQAVRDPALQRTGRGRGARQPRRRRLRSRVRDALAGELGQREVGQVLPSRTPRPGGRRRTPAHSRGGSHGTPAVPSQLPKPRAWRTPSPRRAPPEHHLPSEAPPERDLPRRPPPNTSSRHSCSGSSTSAWSAASRRFCSSTAVDTRASRCAGAAAMSSNAATVRCR